MFLFKKNEFMFEFIVAFLLFFLVIFLKFPVLNLPYSWDSMNYIIPAAQYIFNNGFAFFFWEYSNGHPPFYFILLGFVFKLFGNTPFIANLFISIFSFLTVFFTYLTGKFIFNKKVGVIAALLMFFYPTFFSYSGLSYLAIPLAAFTIMSIYFFITKNNPFYVIFSSFLVLTAERSVCIPIALIFYRYLKNKKVHLKKDFVFFLPIIVFLLWLLSNKFYYGYFMYPISVSFLDINPVQVFFNSFIILKNLFFDYSKWILTSFIIFSCFSFRYLRFNKKLVYKIFFSLIFFIFFFNLPKFSMYFEMFYPNILTYFLIVKKFSLFFSILLLIFLVYMDRFIKIWGNEKFYPLYLVFILSFLSYIFFVFSPRYALPIYPIIFLIFSYALVRIFKKYSYLIFFIILLIFVIQFSGHTSKVGFVLENNMEYVDAIKTHQIAVDYLQNEFSDSIILASFPQSFEVKYPYLGYINKSLNVVSIPTYPGLLTRNYTIFLNPWSYNKTIDLNSIDILYYSNQEYNTKYSKELSNILNKTLVKRFEMNGKVAEIYKINKDRVYPNYTMYLD